jgi:CAAX prenyl protease-like protein
LGSSYSSSVALDGFHSQAAWIIFRCIGSVVTVPLVEELVFRGYLLNKLTNHPLLAKGNIAFSWLPFLLSSLLFGLMHGEWIAGTIAGMFFAFARYRRGSLGDAVVAHMTTNGLLTCYVMLTGTWSYW